MHLIWKQQDTIYPLSKQFIFLVCLKMLIWISIDWQELEFQSTISGCQLDYLSINIKKFISIPCPKHYFKGKDWKNMEKSWDFSLEVRRKRLRGKIKQKPSLCFSYWLDKVPNIFFSALYQLRLESWLLRSLILLSISPGHCRRILFV